MLMPFEPFREFDRLCAVLASGAVPSPPFPMRSHRHGEECVLSFDLPGPAADMAPGTIDLTVEQNVLTITAQRGSDGGPGDEAIADEPPHSARTHRVFLGPTLDAEHLVARYENGVLILCIPVAEAL